MPYPSQVAALLGAPLDWRNVAIGGTDVSQMISRAATRVDPLYRTAPQTKPQIVILWGGTNNLSNATTTYNNIKSYCTARQTVGWKCVILTILPRTQAGISPSFETLRQSVNASLRADFPTATGESNIWTGASYADYLVDIGSDSTIGDTGDELNTTYYLDKVHLTSAGYAIIADYVKKAIQLFP